MSVITAVGDVRVYRPNPDPMFRGVSDLLKGSDIAFCQSESSYSDKGSMGSSGLRGASPRDLNGYPAFASAGFNVVSMASNHAMDWGRDALLDTIERMRSDGMHTIGAGSDIEEARQPAILEINGTAVAFLGYCSVAPKSYYAVPGRAGVAPMRAITHYEPLEEDQPGTPSQIMTWPLERDLEALEEDVRRSKEKADIVIVSLHWGVHWIPGLIADYQPEVARAAIDVGASAVVGHHPHLVKGVDFHKGKPILYSLGNFAHDTNSAYRPTDQAWRQELKKTYALYGTPGPHDYRQLSEARYSMILSLEISRKGIETVSFLPVVIDEASVPEVVSASSPIGKEIASYLDQVSHDAGFTPDFAVDGERVLARPGR